jgi:hypothetical protein
VKAIRRVESKADKTRYRGEYGYASESIGFVTKQLIFVPEESQAFLSLLIVPASGQKRRSSMMSFCRRYRPSHH